LQIAFKMQTVFILAFIAATILWAYLNLKADKANIRTAWYSRFVGVLPILPESPFDQTVQARADVARQLFAEHGNVNAEVVPYFYGLPIGKDGTAALTFDAFLRMAAVDYLARCDAFIAEKNRKDSRAAAQHIGGQTVVLEISNKEYLKP
jgi:hypothetical protein